MSRRRKGLAPTLFPFLAVLVCTLGTLILLLALVAQNATDAAQQEANAPSSSLAEQTGDETDAPHRTGDRPLRITSAEVEQRLAEAEFRIVQLVSHRTAQTAELEKKRDELTHLEQHLQRVVGQLQQLREEVERATSDEKASTNTDDLVLLRQAIEDEQQALQQLESEQQSREPRIVIVPHQGPNGTDRRPVYLECTASGVTIWPEGSSISLAQLEASTPAANPLDQALRVIRHHAMQHYEDSIPPYPLLIVRPDGIDSYAVARQAMADWDDQFGYELVPANVELAFPQSDPALKERIDLAIRDAVRGQQALQRFVAGAAGRGPFAGRPAPRGSGVSGATSPTGTGGSSTDPASESVPARPLPSLSAAKLDRMARASGYKAASGFDAASVSDPDDRFNRSRFNQQAPTDDSWQTNHFDVAPANPGSLTPQSQAANNEPRDTNSTATREGTAAPDSTTALSSAAALSNATALSSAAKATGGIAGSYDGTAESIEGVTERIDNRGNQPPSDHVRGSELAADSELALNPAHREAAEQVDDDRPEGSGGTQSHNMNQAMSSSQNAGNSASISGTTTPPPQAPNASQQAPASVTAQASDSSPPRTDMVRRQGKDWALPSHMSGVRGTSVVRTLRVVCYPDRYVLLPSTNGGAMEVFGLSDRDPHHATLQLATAIRDRVARWGAPLPGGRWQPRLDVQVAPQAEARFDQLRSFMDGSGVEVRPVPSSGSPTR